MVNRLIGEYNYEKHFARYRSRLLSALGDDIGKPFDLWNGLPCYGLYFTCDNNGFIRKLGDRKGFSDKEMETNYFGRYKIAVDFQPQIHAAGLAGPSYNNASFRHLIIQVKVYRKEVPKIIIPRLLETGKVYNEEFGYYLPENGEYDGFTAGNVLEEGML